MGEYGAQLRQIGLQPIKMKLIERLPSTGHCGGVRTGRTNEFGQQGVELRRWGIAQIATRIHPNTCARGFLIGRDTSRTRGNDASLYGKTARRADCVLITKTERGERFTRGETKLGLDHINTGDLFGDGMLNLNARITFNKKILAGLGRDQELDGAGIHIRSRLHKGERIGKHLLSQRGVQPRSGGHLNDLLVAQLDRTVAFVQMNDIALGVRQNLDLDMSGPRDQSFEKDGSVTECSLSFAATALKCLGHLLGPFNDAHTAPSAPGCGLEHHGIIKLTGQRLCFSG